MVSLFDPSETANLEEAVNAEFKAISQELNKWLNRVGYNQKQTVAINNGYSMIVQSTTDDSGCIVFTKGREWPGKDQLLICIDLVENDVLVMASEVLEVTIKKINEDLRNKEIAAATAIALLNAISDSIYEAMNASTSIVETDESESSTDSEESASEEAEAEPSPDPEYLLLIPEAEAKVARAGLSDEVDSIELTMKQKKALERAGITRISQIIVRTEYVIAHIHNFGTKSLRCLKAKLKSHGLSLRE